MAKQHTNSLYSISTAFLRRYFRNGGHGVMLVNGKAVCRLSVRNDSVRIRYTATAMNGRKEDIDEMVPLVWTACHYGGQRRWFICPWCGRRCGVLYMSVGVACRKCFDLVYSCQANRGERNWHMYWRMLERVGGAHSEKPKRMRWKTYLRLREAMNRIAMRNAMPLFKRCGRIL